MTAHRLVGGHLEPEPADEFIPTLYTVGGVLAGALLAAGGLAWLLRDWWLR